MANDDNREEGAALGSHRAAIDAIDRDLLRLLNERAAHAKAIGALKTGAAYRPEREAQGSEAMKLPKCCVTALWLKVPGGPR